MHEGAERARYMVRRIRLRERNFFLSTSSEAHRTPLQGLTVLEDQEDNRAADWTPTERKNVNEKPNLENTIRKP